MCWVCMVGVRAVETSSCLDTGQIQLASADLVQDTAEPFSHCGDTSGKTAARGCEKV